MATPADFRHLDLHGLLPDAEWSSETQDQWVSAVTPKGREYVIRHGGLPSLGDPGGWVLSRHGLLQVCLLRTELFQNSRDDEILDPRSSPSKAARCENRPLLIEGCADALLGYEGHLWALEVEAPEIPKAMMEAWATLGLPVRVYSELRRRKYLSGRSPRLALREASLKQAHETLRHVIQTLTPEDYLRAAKISQDYYRTLLYIAIKAAFSLYGPPHQVYRDVAINYAIAVILSAVNVETGPSTTAIAARIGMRIKRALLPSSPQ
jgi:hypothetical protein